MMYALRKELNLFDVPVILGGLGDYLSAYPKDKALKNYTHINEALKCIAKNNTMTGFVSAEGLTSNPDFLHFNAESLYRFGIRYFEEWERLQGKLQIPVENTASDLTRSEMELL